MADGNTQPRKRHTCVGFAADPQKCERCAELREAGRAVEQAYARLHKRAHLELLGPTGPES